MRRTAASGLSPASLLPVALALLAWTRIETTVGHRGYLFSWAEGARFLLRFGVGWVTTGKRNQRPACPRVCPTGRGRIAAYNCFPFVMKSPFTCNSASLRCQTSHPVCLRRWVWGAQGMVETELCEASPGSDMASPERVECENTSSWQSRTNRLL